MHEKQQSIVNVITKNTRQDNANDCAFEEASRHSTTLFYKRSSIRHRIFLTNARDMALYVTASSVAIQAGISSHTSRVFYSAGDMPVIFLKIFPTQSSNQIMSQWRNECCQNKTEILCANSNNGNTFAQLHLVQQTTWVKSGSVRIICSSVIMKT